MGREFAANLGLNHARLMLAGLLIVSAISAVVVVTAGSIPFLGLIVPNAVSLLLATTCAAPSLGWRSWAACLCWPAISSVGC